MKKKLIGQLITIKFTDRKSLICGFVIDYNDEWTLMKYNVVDFIIDGYIIFRHKNIEGFRRGKRELFHEKVIKLKGLQPTVNEIIPISNLQSILTYLNNKYGVFGYHTKSEKTYYIGRLKSLDKKKLVIDWLDTNGKWNGQRTCKPNDIRTIDFDTDYINSLKLVADKTRKK
jgi:hypothetical protein